MKQICEYFGMGIQIESKTELEEGEKVLWNKTFSWKTLLCFEIGWHYCAQ